MIERMFEESEAPEETAADAVAVERIQTSTRQERIEAAAKLEAIADLIGIRHQHEHYAAREYWAADGWSSVQAEVAAAAECSMAVAQRQMLIAWDLRTKLPQVAAVFRRGLIPAPVVGSITWQTHLITDHAILGVVDAELAEQSLGYGVLSEQKVTESIQSVIDNVDPDAVRRQRMKARECDMKFGKPDDATGTVSVYGAMDATEAAVLKARLNQMADTVCTKDPRTRGQRRSAANAALAAGKTRLDCLCGTDDCPAAGQDEEEGFAHLHLYALVDADLLDTPHDPLIYGGTDADDDVEPSWAHREPTEPEAEPDRVGDAASESESPAEEPPAPDPVADPAVPQSEPVADPASEVESALAGESPTEESPDPAAKPGTEGKPLRRDRHAQTRGPQPQESAAPQPEPFCEEPAAAPPCDAEVADREPDPASQDRRPAQTRAPQPQESAAPQPESPSEEPDSPQPRRPDPEGPGEESARSTPPQPETPVPVSDPPPVRPKRDRKRRRGPAAVILGGWRLTPAQVGDLVHGGARVHTLKSFRDAPAENHYRFSPALTAFIRSRDLTCRFPNCTVTADRCDIDHTEPYPFGSTHASNGQCHCRTHHLLKTFWVGEKGWSYIQLPDGTLIITTPSGHTYRTVPGSRRLFPHLAADTGPAPPGEPKDTTKEQDSPDKGMRMPKRKATREQQRRYAIQTERERNRKLNAEHESVPEQPAE